MNGGEIACELVSHGGRGVAVEVRDVGTGTVILTGPTRRTEVGARRAAMKALVERQAREQQRLFNRHTEAMIRLAPRVRPPTIDPRLSLVDALAEMTRATASALAAASRRAAKARPARRPKARRRPK